MHAGRLLGHEQRVADLAVRAPLGHQDEHLALARGEAEGIRRWAAASPAGAAAAPSRCRRGRAAPGRRAPRSRRAASRRRARWRLVRALERGGRRLALAGGHVGLAGRQRAAPRGRGARTASQACAAVSCSAGSALAVGALRARPRRCAATRPRPAAVLGGRARAAERGTRPPQGAPALGSSSPRSRARCAASASTTTPTAATRARRTTSSVQVSMRSSASADRRAGGRRGRRRGARARRAARP